MIAAKGGDRRNLVQIQENRFIFNRKKDSDHMTSSPASMKSLIGVVQRFAAFGLSWRAGETAKITPATHQVAEAFLRALPAAKALPKIAPDGEGGLLMIWEGTSRFLLTISDLRLDGVLAPGTPHAEYIDDMPPDPVQVIPGRILNAIPAR